MSMDPGLLLLVGAKIAELRGNQAANEADAVLETIKVVVEECAKVADGCSCGGEDFCRCSCAARIRWLAGEP